MALQKTNLPINFSQGLDTKTDPFQLAPGKFLELENMTFNTGGLLQKIDGFGFLKPLPDISSTFLTTFNGNLTAVGTSIQAYSSGSESWVSKGNYQPIDLNILSLIRSNSNQSQADSAISSSGLICTVFTDKPDGNPLYKYVIADLTTGQNIIAPTLIPVTSGVVTGSPRVFVLGSYFVLVFTNVISAVNHLQYIAISILNPTSVSTNINISSSYIPATSVAFDGIVSNNALYLAWAGGDIGGAVRMTYIDQTLTQHTTIIIAGHTGTIFTLAEDSSGSTAIIYVAFYDSASSTGYVFAVTPSLINVLGATEFVSSGTLLNLAATAVNGGMTLLYEVSNAYDYDSGIPTNYIEKITVAQDGTIISTGIIVRSVGLASKAILRAVAGGFESYFLVSYQSLYQSTYFLANGHGEMVGKLAYGNGGGYLTTGLPNLQYLKGIAYAPYLVKDLISAVNKGTAVPAGTQTAGIYSQTGINLSEWTMDSSLVSIESSEIASDLHLSGGFLWMYDGYLPVEHLFHLWPDSIEATWSASGGSIAAKPDTTTNTDAYWYQVTYEWSDNQGNIFRSAPSIPIPVTTSGSGTSGSITVHIPTLRLTYKLANPVKIVVYRWSVAQQVYYQTTSLSVPTLNDTTVDSVTFIDENSDAMILGNNILYTTGGVVENIAAPACFDMTLYKSRLIVIDAEDRNLLWYSKQVIENTPVETSDLFTLYIAPTIGAQQSTGPLTSLSTMDDKLILFKRDAIYYLTGSGPDNTGSQNDFSDPIFITSTVGCSNKRSIVFMPMGIMFQSDKGIWLLGQDLSTSYIGAPVQAYNSDKVTSALNIPGTNQVRFTLDSGTILVFDYFYGQWETIPNVRAVSSTLYQNLQTFINIYGEVLQETPGVYLNGTLPLTMKFKTGWFNLASLQGYQRAYGFYLLGLYKSPHKLQIDIAFDYQSSPSQTVLINPDNFSGTWGSDPFWGSGPTWGGVSPVEQWRIFFSQQQCQAFQLTVTEIYDPSYGVPSGPGLTLSGIDLIYAVKKGSPRLRAAVQVG